MQVEKYLKEYQPVIYKTFLNSFQKDHLSHAYLLSGNPGTPLLEVAKFLSKAILCDDPSPLACNNCITCLRIDDNNYPDFIIFDGSKATIKKDEVASVEEQFEKTAFESKGIMIYVLHLHQIKCQRLTRHHYRNRKVVQHLPYSLHFPWRLE